MLRKFPADRLPWQDWSVLKSQILSAVRAAKSAFEDLLVEVQYVVRTTATYEPGNEYVATEGDVTDVRMAFTRFDSREIDGDRIQASDWRCLIFPEVGLPRFNTNDVIRVPTGLQDIIAGDYRIKMYNPVMAGDTVVLHQMQLRKL